MCQIFILNLISSKYSNDITKAGKLLIINAYTKLATFVYRKQNLQFKPPIEDVRRKYYARLRKFLSLPLHFKGVVEKPGAPTIFPKTGEK